jgi:hypothetical protein
LRTTPTWVNDVKKFATPRMGCPRAWAGITAVMMVWPNSASPLRTAVTTWAPPWAWMTSTSRPSSLKNPLRRAAMAGAAEIEISEADVTWRTLTGWPEGATPPWAAAGAPWVPWVAGAPLWGTVLGAAVGLAAPHAAASNRAARAAHRHGGDPSRICQAWLLAGSRCRWESCRSTHPSPVLRT